MNIKTIVVSLTLLFLVNSCLDNNQNTDSEGQDVLTKHVTHKKISDSAYTDTVYVPIYSEIYSKTKNIKFLLTATLSIRNTSLYDTMYVSTIDYYNTGGDLVKQYLDKNISLKPMETIDYVIEEDDKSGGTGANFIIVWSARRSDLNPVFQGVMISVNGQQGVSYITNGVSVKKK